MNIHASPCHISRSSVGPYAWGGLKGTNVNSASIRLYGLTLTVANTLDCILFITGTFVFLFAITKALGISKLNTLTTIATDYNGVDYLILVVLKLYILWCGVYYQKFGESYFTKPWVCIVLFSVTLEIYTFINASYDTAGGLLSSISIGQNMSPKEGLNSKV
jgi:hypothetical protein